MLLIQQKKGKPGVMEVAWMWLPHFLAADRELQKYADQQLGEKFKNQPLTEDLMTQMHEYLLTLLLDKHPVPGLRRLLETYVYLRPEQLGEEKL